MDKCRLNIADTLRCFDNKQVVPLVAPLGSGKTCGTIKYCDDNGYSFLLVVPNKSNILDSIYSYGLDTYYNNENTQIKFSLINNHRYLCDSV